MRKIYHTILILFFFCHFANAQYVAIVDTQFAIWLKANGYNQCFNGYRLDTTCNAILNTTFLNADNITGHLAFKNLDGVQYFKNLDTLSFNSDSLYSLVPLPSKLKWLISGGNFMTNLPDLPPTLEKLYCQTGALTSIPKLPSTLKILLCEFNSLTSLPSLPDSLIQLECNDNYLTSLPDLPDSLRVLLCGNNPNLTCFPFLKRIVYFNFYNAGIACVPNYGNVDLSIPSLTSLPLCSTYNPYSCQTYTAVNDVEPIDFGFYPNPATSTLFCTITQPLPNTTLQIFGTDGRLIQTQPVVKENTEVDVSALSSGLYFLSVQNEKQRVVRKFVKD